MKLPQIIWMLIAACLLAWFGLSLYSSLERGWMGEKKRNIARVAALSTSDLGTNGTLLGVEVRGDDVFRLRILQALTLLQLSAPNDLTFVTNHIKGIQEGQRSGVQFTDPPVFTMSKTSALYSITWCAGSICHDAYHVKVHRELCSRHISDPRDLASQERIERQCLSYQFHVLKRVGASNYERNWVKNPPGSYLDLDGDGKYDWKDYHLRDW